MLFKFFLKPLLRTSSRRDKLASRAYKATKTVSLVISHAEGHFTLKHCTFTSQNHTSAVVSAFKAAPGRGTWICFLSSANKCSNMYDTRFGLQVLWSLAALPLYFAWSWYFPSDHIRKPKTAHQQRLASNCTIHYNLILYPLAIVSENHMLVCHRAT